MQRPPSKTKQNKKKTNNNNNNNNNNKPEHKTGSDDLFQANVESTLSWLFVNYRPIANSDKGCYHLSISWPILLQEHVGGATHIIEYCQIENTQFAIIPFYISKSISMII